MDLSKCKVYGFGLEKVNVGCFVEFIVEIKGVGVGGFSLVIEGFFEVKLICNDYGDGICFVKYIFIEFGDYEIYIKFVDEYIFGSFFNVKVCMI